MKNVLSMRLLQFLAALCLLSAIPAKAAQFGDFTYSATATEVTITGYTGSGGAVTIPSAIGSLPVASIGDLVFYNKITITSVIIPSSVTFIGNDAFSGCRVLTSVIIPNSVNYIGSQAFAYCTALTSVTIGNSVTIIGQSAFRNCIGLTNVTIPYSVTSISDAFTYCTGLIIVYFQGNAPDASSWSNTPATVYYRGVTTGWGPTFAGRPTVQLLMITTITSQPVNVTTLQGTTATFSVAAIGASGYQWQKNGANIPLATSATLILSNVQQSDATNYTVIVYNLDGNVTSNAAILTVVVAPTIALQPVSISSNQGAGATFSVTAIGGGTYTYQWKKMGLNIVGATAATLVLNNVQPADAATYSVTVTNAMGTVTSNAATLTVVVPPAIIDQPTNIIANPGEAAAFSTVVTGSPSTYQWARNGVIVAGATSPSLSFSAIQPVHVGTYKVLVSNAAGSVMSTSVSLTLNTVFTQTQYDVIADAAQAEITNSPNNYGLYNLSQVQALHVGTPLLAKDPASGKFKLTIGVEKSTNLVNFSPMVIPVGAATINAQGKMEFQFTSPDNAAFFRIESR
jgi:hypothetical protein